MHDRHAADGGPIDNVSSDGSERRPISFLFVKNKQPDRSYFVRKRANQIRDFLSYASRELYHSLVTTLSLDQISLVDFKKFIWPVISSGAALAVGELVTTGLSVALTESKEYDFIFKFLLGATILGYSAAHRITDRRPESTAQLSAAVASEVLAVTSLYASTFRGSQLLLAGRIPDAQALITSLGVSSLAVPGALAHLVKKIQQRLVRRQYALGAQRSDTALIPSGLTRVANYYFLANHFLMSEMAVPSRSFQVGLIADNVTYAHLALQRIRNLPALLTDAGPPVVKSLISQQDKIAADYQYNTVKQKILRFTDQGPEYIEVKRYQLRNGDLVSCDENFDCSSVPVSGEVITFQDNGSGMPTQQLAPTKVSINLKAHNGEDVWIEHETSAVLPDSQKKVDLHAIHDGKQTGILAGAKLNIYGAKHCYIRIQEQTERTFSSDYVKQAVINQIVSRYKQRQVMYSALLAVGMAAVQSRDLASFTTTSLRLLFNLFQMMIPFSETFLREMVNGRLMREINQNLPDTPMETIDALRVVDFCNAMAGYYKNRFTRGVAIVSDKTGTLTTAKMNVLGCWIAEMPVNVQTFLQEGALLLPLREKQLACYEVFASAYTNSRKEIEPEEFAILKIFKGLFNKDDYLKVETLGNNHFRKTLATDQGEKTIETLHLGLYRSLGGRFTLVDEGEKKYLVFCGVPRADKFRDTPLLSAYASMNIRTGVLSRDWCVARAPLSAAQFAALKGLFSQDNKPEIDRLLCSSPEILHSLTHYGTFLIDNPVKKGVEKFVAQCRRVNVPVLVATGDTIKSAENIAKVLCAENTKHIISIRSADDLVKWRDKEFPQAATVIFSGINDDILSLFQQILDIDIQRRPVVIFSEMSTEGKGVLTRYLKDQSCFVVANGDGTNDVAMMRHADMVIAHVAEDGGYAPGVGQFANLSDRQLRGLLHSDRSFYELFDIDQPHSLFSLVFARLANSQEKPSVALLLKSSKMSFELARSMGMQVTDIPGQHWWGVGFDLAWLWFAFDAINATTDLPMDDKSLDESDFSTRCLLATFVMVLLQTFATYAISGESTNLTLMFMMLSFLPIILRSIFSGFGQVQEEVHPAVQIVELTDDAAQSTVAPTAQEKADAVAAPVHQPKRGRLSGWVHSFFDKFHREEAQKRGAQSQSGTSRDFTLASNSQPTHH